VKPLTENDIVKRSYVWKNAASAAIILIALVFTDSVPAQQFLGAKAGILQHGKVVRSSQPVPFHQASEISSIVRYVHNVHGLAPLQPWFDITLDTLGAGKSTERASSDRESQPMALVNLMGVDYVRAWQAKVEDGFHRFQRREDAVYTIRGYDHLLGSIALGQKKELASKSFPLGLDTLRVALSPGAVVLTSLSRGSTRDSVAMDLAVLVRRLCREFSNPEIPGDVMTCSGQGRALDVRMLLHDIVARTEGDSIRVLRIEMDVLVGRSSTAEKSR